MLKLIKIGITGTLASGKTTVCLFLKKLGAYIVNTDKIVHQLLSPESRVYKKVVKEMGLEKTITTDTSALRKEIADIVFYDPKKLEKLEQIIHPEVKKIIDKEEKKALNLGFSIFAVEVPLLFEANWQKNFDATVAVISDETQCINRYLQTGKTSKEYRSRMKRQLSSSKKAKKADYVINNNGDLNHLKIQVKKLYKLLNQ